LHLPILYRKGNSNLSGCLSFALASGLKGFMHANFGRISGNFRVGRRGRWTGWDFAFG
jgi:hypothetical protein